MVKKGCVMLKTNVSIHMILHVHQRQKHRIFLFRFIMSAPVLEGGPTVPRPYRNSHRKKEYKFMDKMNFIKVYKEVATQN